MAVQMHELVAFQATTKIVNTEGGLQTAAGTTTDE